MGVKYGAIHALLQLTSFFGRPMSAFTSDILPSAVLYSSSLTMTAISAGQPEEEQRESNPPRRPTGEAGTVVLI